MKGKIDRTKVVNSQAFTNTAYCKVNHLGHSRLKIRLANFKQDKLITKDALEELLTEPFYLEYGTYNPLKVIDNCICGKVLEMEYDEITGWLTGIVIPYGPKRRALTYFVENSEFITIVPKAIYIPGGTVNQAKYTKVISFMLKNYYDLI